MQNKPNPDDISNIIAEIRSLESDLGAFREGIQKIKNAPQEKGAHIISEDHEVFLAELEEIAQKIEGLPKKWAGGLKN